MPSNVLALNGAFKHDPKRGAARADEPAAQLVDLPALPIPSELTELEAHVWRDMVHRPHAGTVTGNDLPMFVLMVKLYARIVYEPPMDVKDIGRFQSICASFGMTPADRSRVKVAANAKPAADPMDEFGT